MPWPEPHALTKRECRELSSRIDAKFGRRPSAGNTDQQEAKFLAGCMEEETIKRSAMLFLLKMRPLKQCATHTGLDLKMLEHATATGQLHASGYLPTGQALYTVAAVHRWFRTKTRANA